MLVAGGIGIILILAAAFFVLSGSQILAGTANSSGILPAIGQCSEGMTSCSGKCVNLKTDPENCGKCGFSVPVKETCINGQFSSASGKSTGTGSSSAGSAPTSTAASGTPVSCTAGRISCSGTCRNLVNDIQNCGSCGNACLSGQTCQNSRCVAPATTVPVVSTSIPVTITPELSCSGREAACSGACVDLFSDKKNCGVCGRTCGSQEICVNARCGPACTGDETLCGETCVDLDSDTENCGACGTECSSRLPNAIGSTCTLGKCGFEDCKTDYADCNKKATDGCEVFLRLDAANCGSCGNKCPTGQVCYNKKCSVPVTV